MLLACAVVAGLAFYFLPTRAHERYLFPVFALALLSVTTEPGAGGGVGGVVLAALIAPFAGAFLRAWRDGDEFGALTRQHLMVVGIGARRAAA